MCNGIPASPIDTIIGLGVAIMTISFLIFLLMCVVEGAFYIYKRYFNKK